MKRFKRADDWTVVLVVATRRELSLYTYKGRPLTTPSGLRRNLLLMSVQRAVQGSSSMYGPRPGYRCDLRYQDGPSSGHSLVAIFCGK